MQAFHHIIRITSQSKVSYISEELCIGCDVYVKKYSFDAIEIINLPKDLDKGQWPCMLHEVVTV
ncbi:hypothetical protein HanRHA438_Chr10g0456761 [Helianthus annuus]|nr:hypothetical protein HanIR_Chr10g0479191 [Helianthus annuus]KAJ0879895.1 hypothetical protein HanRHA438_Chr10g0456761 [Helianthus annuus]